MAQIGVSKVGAADNVYIASQPSGSLQVGRAQVGTGGEGFIHLYKLFGRVKVTLETIFAVKGNVILGLYYFFLIVGQYTDNAIHYYYKITGNNIASNLFYFSCRGIASKISYFFYRLKGTPKLVLSFMFKILGRPKVYDYFKYTVKGASSAFYKAFFNCYGTFSAKYAVNYILFGIVQLSFSSLFAVLGSASFGSYFLYSLSSSVQSISNFFFSLSGYAQSYLSISLHKIVGSIKTLMLMSSLFKRVNKLNADDVTLFNDNGEERRYRK